MGNDRSQLKIDINLDKFMKGHNAFPKLGDYVMRGINNGIDRFSDMLLAKLQENLIAYGLGDSKLFSSAVIIKKENGLYITMGSEYAMFVEYGTGIVGANFSHPNLTGIAWQYDVNSHGDSGWWYPTDASDPNPSKRFREGSGWWAWTAGQASRPFMYMTWKWGSQHVTQIIEKDINDELKRWGAKMR